MKISIVIAEGGKQVMFTPETDHEKASLKMIDTEDVLRVVSKHGQFFDGQEHVGYNVAKSRGGYYRPYPDSESLMFVIDDEEATPEKS